MSPRLLIEGPPGLGQGQKVDGGGGGPDRSGEWQDGGISLRPVLGLTCYAESGGARPSQGLGSAKNTEKGAAELSLGSGREGI